jgi:hypothetical protein
LPDSFGQFCVYPTKPDSIPDIGQELADVCDIPAALNPPKLTRSLPDIITPCPNVSAFWLKYWHWNSGDKKSKGTQRSLVWDVISAPDFVPSDVCDLDWDCLDQSHASNALDMPTGWKSNSLSLTVPP